MCSEAVPGRYFLAFDHRGSFERRVGALNRNPLASTATAIVDAKELIFDGVELAASRVPVSQIGILVDDRYGGRVPERARQLGVTVAMPAERSSCEVFEFEHGAAFGERILAEDPDVTKVLVRHNVAADADKLAEQTERLALLSEWLGSREREFLFELLVPPTEEQLAEAGGDVARFERDIRPELICRAMAQLQDGGVEPTTWKLEGLSARADAEAVVSVARREGRDGVDCVLLGAGASVACVNHWLRVASKVDGFVGFAIGRSIWWPPLERYLTGSIDRFGAAEEIARGYAAFVDVFADPRGDGAD